MQHTGKHDLRKNLGSLIKEKRESAGLSRQKMSKFAGFNSTSIMNWERGVNTMSVQTLFIVMQYLNITHKEIEECFNKSNMLDDKPIDYNIDYEKSLNQIKSTKNHIDLISTANNEELYRQASNYLSKVISSLETIIRR